MKKIYLLLAAVLLLGSFLTLSGCAAEQSVSETEPKKNEPITLGSILLLSGDGASWGEAAQNGIEMALDEINANGGVNGRPLEFIHEDGKGDPKVALAAYQRLTRLNNVDYIIGPNWSTVALALSDIADADETVMISPSVGVAEFNEASPFLFTARLHDFLLSEDLAENLFASGARNIAIFGTKQAWVTDQTHAIKERFEALGGQVSLVFEPTLDQRNLQTEVLKVTQEDSLDAIVITSGLYPIGVQFAKLLKANSIEVPLYSMALDQTIITSAQGAYDGMTVYSSLTPTKAFEQAYEERFDIVIQDGAAAAYDSVMMLADAFREVGVADTKAVARYLNRINNYDGASGNLSSDSLGGFLKPYRVAEVREGVAVVIE